MPLLQLWVLWMEMRDQQWTTKKEVVRSTGEGKEEDDGPLPLSMPQLVAIHIVKH